MTEEQSQEAPIPKLTWRQQLRRCLLLLGLGLVLMCSSNENEQLYEDKAMVISKKEGEKRDTVSNITNSSSFPAVNHTQIRIQDQAAELRENISSPLPDNMPMSTRASQQLRGQPGSTSNTTTNTSIEDISSSTNLVDPQQNACQQWQESIAALTHVIHEDPEHKSLAPWEDSSNNWRFPPFNQELLQSAFSGRKLLLHGDSTTYYTMKLLHRLLMQGTDAKFWNMALTQPNLTYASNAVEDYFQHNRVKEVNGHRYIGQYKGAYLGYAGFRGPSMSKNCDFDLYIWPKVRDVKPEIFVANWGAHMFYRPSTHIRLCNVYQWLHFDDWMETVLSTALEVGTKVLLFKTTNLVCKSVAPKNFYASVENCVSELRDKMLHADPNDHNSNITISTEDLELYCREATYTDESGQRLNDKMRDFVAKAQKRIDPSRITIAMYNDHDLERCEYGDGIHYLPLLMPRIRVISHMVQCLWPKEKTTPGLADDTNK